MNRRGFLTGILALGAAPAIVRATSLMPGRAIWVPGHLVAYGSMTVESEFVLPVTYDQITREALRILQGNIILREASRPDWDKAYATEPGYVHIRIPAQYRIRT